MIYFHVANHCDLFKLRNNYSSKFSTTCNRCHVYLLPVQFILPFTAFVESDSLMSVNKAKIVIYVVHELRFSECEFTLPDICVLPEFSANHLRVYKKHWALLVQLDASQPQVLLLRPSI